MACGFLRLASVARGPAGSIWGPCAFSQRTLFLFSAASVTPRRLRATLSRQAWPGSAPPPAHGSVLGCKGQSCAVTRQRREGKANLEPGGTARAFSSSCGPEGPLPVVGARRILSLFSVFPSLIRFPAVCPHERTRSTVSFINVPASKAAHLQFLLAEAAASVTIFTWAPRAEVLTLLASDGGV